MTKFTEGPWEVKLSPFEVYNMDHGALKYHLVQGEIMIAALYSDCDSPEAHLIAAAPCNYNEHQALLDIVKAAIKAGDWKVDGACDPEQQIKRSETALAKARGEV